ATSRRRHRAAPRSPWPVDPRGAARRASAPPTHGCGPARLHRTPRRERVPYEAPLWSIGPTLRRGMPGRKDRPRGSTIRACPATPHRRRRSHTPRRPGTPSSPPPRPHAVTGGAAARYLAELTARLETVLGDDLVAAWV